jgi:hypothetical protein
MATRKILQNNLFLDASYIIALSTPKDNFHQVAVELSKSIGSLAPRIVTSHAILLEIGNSLSKMKYRSTAVGILNAIAHDPRVEIIDVTASLYSEALRLYTSRPDKEWGLTDCVSFIIMQQREIQQALTADEHFVQAGYQAVMR